MNLEEYEVIVADHGHKSVYYPKDIIQIKLREELIEKLTISLEDDEDPSLLQEHQKNTIKEIINKCFRGYD